MAKSIQKEYARQIIRNEIGETYFEYEVLGTGTTNKNYSFVIKKLDIPKYFLKIHGKGKPQKEKKSSEFYQKNNIVKTPEIFSVGEDYTITFFETGLREPTFQEHVMNLADFHNNLVETNHYEFANDLNYKMPSRKTLLELIEIHKPYLNKIISYSDFTKSLSELPNPEEIGIDNCLIHGDPHSQNLTIKNEESLFVDLEHTRYTRPTVDLARLIFNYLPSELENILAIYISKSNLINKRTSKRNFIGATLSDLLIDGAATIATCYVKKVDSSLQNRWNTLFRNYFEFLNEKTL